VADSTLKLLAELPVQTPAAGGEVELLFWHETDDRVVLIARVRIGAPLPPYSAAYEKETVNVAVSICQHLIGKDCGSEAEAKSAQHWLNALPDQCPAHLLKTWDAEVCKIALHLNKTESYQLYFRDKRKPDPKVHPGEIKVLSRISDLGTRSILK